MSFFPEFGFFWRWLRRALFLIWLLLMWWVLSPLKLFSQDVATGAIRGTIVDATGARIRGASVIVTNQATGLRRGLLTTDDGSFDAQVLPPGSYTIHVNAAGMVPLDTRALTLDLGSTIELRVPMRVAGAPETITINSESEQIVPDGARQSSVIDEQSIQNLPLDGRRFSDLALLLPNVVADTRSLTSDSVGDLSSGGMRGYQTTFLVDGADYNNGFYGQARGRYRAPYQFSNEVVGEFRVNTNNYGTEMGRSGAGVINVVTKSGSNDFHGKAFYFLRDSEFGAANPYAGFKPLELQHQFGGTIGGPIKHDRVFFYAGYDQHIFHVPTVVRFADNSATLVPQPDDYEASDQALVNLAASALNQMTGTFDSQMVGGAGFAKIDAILSPRHMLSVRVNTSIYGGLNSVYFDPASPITHYAITENGEEDVFAASAVASLTSAFSPRITNQLRVQFSHDNESGSPNASYPDTAISGILYGFGRSLILPSQTNENKAHISDSLTISRHHHDFKFGGDVMLSRLYNYFPLEFGGEYMFYPIRVNPFTFAPETYGLSLTTLRAYAHMVPKYYFQNFGTSETNPNGNEYSAFAEDSMRLFHRLNLTLGLRYDRQTYNTAGLVSNPLYPDSGHLYSDPHEIAPRVGFAYSLGDDRPLMIRGGWGLFYSRIPSMYASEVEIENGLNRTTVFLNNSDFYQNQIFPTYPNPLVSCASNAKTCTAPAAVQPYLEREVASFSPNFQMPFAQQASFSLEKEIANKTTLSVAYTYVHGEHLIRARDVNLPPPQPLNYPIYDSTLKQFVGTYTVQSFSGWETTQTQDCAFPPCIASLQRPIPQLGAINLFATDGTSVYNAGVISLVHRMSNSIQFRVGYTYAKAIDDGPDTVSASSPANLENSYDPEGERGLSSNDQRHRVVGAMMWEPRGLTGSDRWLRALTSNWQISTVFTYGSGRPVTAWILGDANQDGNNDNDRVPGYRRNGFAGPNYIDDDLRVGRTIKISERGRLEFIVESFNVFNRNNRRYVIADSGFGNEATYFEQSSTTYDGQVYPAFFDQQSHLPKPNSSYAPRQVQFAARFLY